MDSGNYTTVACTDFTCGETALVEMSIPLIWNLKNLTPRHWDKILLFGDTVSGPDFKFHPQSKDLWRLKLISEPGGYMVSLKIRKVSQCKSTASQFTISWTAESDQGRRTVKKSVKVPENGRQFELFCHEKAVIIHNFVCGSASCNMVIQIEIDDNVDRQIDNSVKCDVTAPDLESSLDKGKLNVLADMESILTNTKFSDVILRSEGQEIKAHRAILAARSKVFESMFEHQMSEQASGSVDISDVLHAVLQRLVTYMYSGRLEDLDVNSAVELFVASDKYAIEDLHETCALFLKRSLTVENCLEMLMLADTHSDKDLKSSAVAYFSRHSKEICQKPDWGCVIKVRPNVMFEVLEVLALK